MKKPKRIRKYTVNGYVFDTFQELKRYIFFHTSLKQKKIGGETVSANNDLFRICRV